MMKKNMVVVFIVCHYLFAGAQNSGFINSTLNESSNRLQGKLSGEIYSLSPLSNSNYFLQKDWEEGTINLKDGDIFKNVRMRYMARNDELVAYNENNRALFIVDKSTIKEFIFYPQQANEIQVGRKFINLDSLNLPQNNCFFEELYSGTAKLFSFHHIEEEKVSPYSGRDGKMYDVEFHLKTTYYFTSQTISFLKIQLKNRSFYSLYPEEKKAIKKILRKNKIDISNENTAVQALELLDASGFFK